MKIEEESLFGEQNPESKIPQPLNWGELNRKKFPDQRWRIKNLVPLEGIVLFAAVSGSGKSWIALEMAKCVACGIPFLGHPEFASEPTNVLILDAENIASETQRRGRMVEMAEEKGSVFMLNQVLNLYGQPNETDQYIDDLEWLIRFVKDKQIGLILIDTLRGVAGGLKEEAANEVRRFFNQIRQVTSLGAAVVMLEHLRKANPFEGKTPKKEQVFSSQDKVASSDVLLLAKKDGEEIYIYQAKNRFSKEINPFRVAIQTVLLESGEERIAFCYQGAVESEEGKLEEARKIILNVLCEGAKTTKEILEATQKSVGQKNTRNALSSLVQEALIEVQRQGKQNKYSLPVEREADLATSQMTFDNFDSS